MINRSCLSRGTRRHRLPPSSVVSFYTFYLSGRESENPQRRVETGMNGTALKNS